MSLLVGGADLAHAVERLLDRLGNLDLLGTHMVEHRIMGPRVRYSTAKATGTLQNAAIASCQQKNSDATNTMTLAMMAPQSSPSTWL